jgi:hypothetical protein
MAWLRRRHKPRQTKPGYLDGMGIYHRAERIVRVPSPPKAEQPTPTPAAEQPENFVREMNREVREMRRSMKAGR